MEEDYFSDDVVLSPNAADEGGLSQAELAVVPASIAPQLSSRATAFSIAALITNDNDCHDDGDDDNDSFDDVSWLSSIDFDSNTLEKTSQDCQEHSNNGRRFQNTTFEGLCILSRNVTVGCI